MSRYSLWIALAVALQLTACASRPATPPAAAPQQTPPAPSVNTAQREDGTTSTGQEDGLQCKTVYSTGSRLDKKKVCTTAAERERIAQAAKEFVDNSSRGYQVISGP